jgi:hypothetical protein
VLAIAVGFLFTVAVALGIMFVVAVPYLRQGSRILTPGGERAIERARKQATAKPRAAAGTTWNGVVGLRHRFTRLGARTGRAWGPVGEALHGAFDRLESRDAGPAAPIRHAASGSGAAPAGPGTASSRSGTASARSEVPTGGHTLVEPSGRAEAEFAGRAEAGRAVAGRAEAGHAEAGPAMVGRPRAVPPVSGPIPEISGPDPVIDLREDTHADAGHAAGSARHAR